MQALAYSRMSDNHRFDNYRSVLDMELDAFQQLKEAVTTSDLKNTSAIQEQSIKIQEAIGNWSKHQSDTITMVISDEAGNLSEKLEDINNELSSLVNYVIIGFSKLAELERITHKFLGKIIELFRIPPDQVTRGRYIEEGLKYYANAHLDPSQARKHYIDALIFFRLAIKLQKKEEKESRDFFSHYFIGRIYLVSKYHLNPKKAARHFRIATHYYNAELNVDGTSTSRFLLNDKFDLKNETAKSFYYLGYSYYLQKKYGEAALNANKAYKINKEYLLAKYMHVKCLFLSGQSEEGGKILRNLINEKPRVYNYIAVDGDLSHNVDIQLVLSKLFSEVHNKAHSLLGHCFEQAIDKSESLAYLFLIKGTIHSRKYLDQVKGIELLTAKKIWELRRSYSDEIKNGINTLHTRTMCKDISPSPFEIANSRRFLTLDNHPCAVLEFIQQEKSHELLISLVKRIAQVKLLVKQIRETKLEMGMLLSRMSKERDYYFDKSVNLGILLSILLSVITTAIFAWVTLTSETPEKNMPLLSLSTLAALVSFIIYFVSKRKLVREKKLHDGKRHAAKKERLFLINQEKNKKRILKEHYATLANCLVAVAYKPKGQGSRLLLALLQKRRSTMFHHRQHFRSQF